MSDSPLTSKAKLIDGGSSEIPLEDTSFNMKNLYLADNYKIASANILFSLAHHQHERKKNEW